MSDKQAACAAKKTSIGGQALIEGVMMRGPYKTAMAVRHTSGEIRMDEWDNPKSKNVFTKVPFIRGIFNFISSMVVGYKCLMKSAEMSGMEELEDDENKPMTEEEKEKQQKQLSKLMPIVSAISAVLGVLLAIVLFTWLPTFLYDNAIAPLFGLNSAPTEGVVTLESFLKALITGVMKILIFLGYMILVSQMKDIKRVFRYHGAEHKTIFCYEHGEELTVENVRKQSRFHPRCGTSFMILMLFVGVAVSMFIPVMADMRWLYVTIKILTIPLVVGIGYELLKLAGRYDNLFTRIISAPGKWMQRITTKEPDDSMIECAIAAFAAVVPEDKTADNW
ncbi:MAG: DUF1385 domain-containing protein [Clostridia bacterium]|nr:DUF1385 domain-containing protein [Clostridia bacterium]